jgi:hypothetical protein
MSSDFESKAGDLDNADAVMSDHGPANSSRTFIGAESRRTDHGCRGVRFPPVANLEIT